MARRSKTRSKPKAKPPRGEPAKTREAPPRAPLVSMPGLARWMLPGMALLLFVASWVRFAQVAANNRPPLRLVALEGDEPWPERELLRIRCGFNGQFLATGDRVWIPCAPGPRRWELIRWDFARGVAERRWRARHSPKDSSTLEEVQRSGLPMPPVIAAAIRLERGDLALIMHGAKPATTVELVIARREGGLSHHPLPAIKVGALVGFATVGGRYELLTADCRRHVFEPGKPLVSAPLAGCPYDGKTVVEWSQRTKQGWRFIYARQSQTPGRYALFGVQPGADTAQPLGTLREATKTTRGEKLDMTPGNVLPVALSQWPTHRMTTPWGKPQALEPPPKALLEGLSKVSRGGKQIYLMGTQGLRRLHLWYAKASSARVAPQAARARPDPKPPPASLEMARAAPHPLACRREPRRSKGTAARGHRAAPEPEPPPLGHRPVCIGRHPGQGRGKLDLRLPRWVPPDRRRPAPHGRPRATRPDPPHLAAAPPPTQPPVRPPRSPGKTVPARGLTHRMALPVVLLGLPVLALLLLPLGLGAGRRLDKARPWRASLTRPVWPWIVTAGTYLVTAGGLLWPFWQVTTAF